MDNVYAPPGRLNAAKPEQERSSGCLARLFALFLSGLAMFSALIAVFGFIDELRGDGFVSYEVAAVLALSLAVPLWFRAAWCFWRARPWGWLWTLAPVPLGLLVIVVTALFEVIAEL